MPRSVNPNPIKLPYNRQIVNKRLESALKGMSHVLGQAAAIRFFDPNSTEDFLALKKILSHKVVKNWMDEAGNISKSDYKLWAGKETVESFLFAVHDIRLASINKVKTIRGFVNFYFERSEKYRLKRLIKSNLINPQAKHYLEVSMALLMDNNNVNQSSGLMSSALRQGCLQVKSILSCHRQSDLVIFGFVDSTNQASIRAMRASGFVKKGKIKYDSNSETTSLLYVISWPKLHQKIKGTLLKLYENKAKVIREAQKTDSHCGPAIVKALLDFNHVEVTQEQVISAAKVEKRLKAHGMTPDQLAQAVGKLAPNLRFWYKQNTSSRDLFELIKKHQLPVGINWQGMFYDSVREEKKEDPHGDHGHFSLVIDFEPKKDEITIDDPYSEYFNTSRIFSFRWFKKRWWDKDVENGKLTETHKYIFVVVPKNITFPPKLGLNCFGQLKGLNRN